VQSALLSAERAEEIGLGRDRIILSAKVSAVQDLIAVYLDLAKRSDYALHLGLTEAGMGSKGIVASAAALSVLLQDGIGDTIRISLTTGAGRRSHPRGEGRAGAPADHGLSGVRALWSRPCPGCGRTTSTTFQELARDIQGFIHTSMPEWKKQYPGVETLNVAVMGCIVNGPRREQARRHRHLAPGYRRDPGGAGLHRREEVGDLRGANVAAEFKQMVIDYIERRFGQGGTGRTAAE